MIYVMLSAVCPTPDCAEEEIELGMKIGYLPDNTKFCMIKRCNPTAKIIVKIKGGTKKDLDVVLDFLRDYSYEGTNEWFPYSDEVMSFFKSHPTIYDIRKFLGI